MKTITMYESDDGTWFQTVYECVEHEFKVGLSQFKSNYNELNGLNGKVTPLFDVNRMTDDDSPVCVNKIVDWIIDNRVIIKDLIDSCNRFNNMVNAV